MKGQQRANVSMCFALVVALMISSACSVVGGQGGEYPSTLGSLRYSGHYRIDPATILASLNSGESHVFFPISASPGSDTLMPSGTYPWQQADYLMIASALNAFVWRDQMADWNVYAVGFRRACGTDMLGFDSFDITYFRAVDKGSSRVYEVRRIEIHPLAADVMWTGGSDYARPLLGAWRQVALVDSSVTAEQALEIAESHGGKAYSQATKNDCQILVDRPASGNTDKWGVLYYPGPGLTVTVDPSTGEYSASPGR